MFTPQEFADYTDQPVEDVNTGLVEQLTREAKILIRHEDRNLPEDAAEWPEVAKVVGLRVVARGYDRRQSGIPSTAESSTVTAGPFSQGFGFGSSSSGNALWLTKDDKKLLHGARGRGGAFAVDLMPNPDSPRFSASPEWWS